MDERALKFWDKWIGRGMKLIVLWAVIGILTGLFLMNKFFDAQNELTKNVQERSQALNHAFDGINGHHESTEYSFNEESEIGTLAKVVAVETSIFAIDLGIQTVFPTSHKVVSSISPMIKSMNEKERKA